MTTHFGVTLESVTSILCHTGDAQRYYATRLAQEAQDFQRESVGVAKRQAFVAILRMSKKAHCVKS